MYPEPRRVGVTPAYGIFARHVRDLELANIRLSFASEDLRPAIMCEDVDGLEIDHFKAEISAGVAPGRFEGVKNLTIHNSPALQGLTGR